jgi:hypothetical protein
MKNLFALFPYSSVDVALCPFFPICVLSSLRSFSSTRISSFPRKPHSSLPAKLASS